MANLVDALQIFAIRLDWVPALCSPRVAGVLHDDLVCVPLLAAFSLQLRLCVRKLAMPKHDEDDIPEHERAVAPPGKDPLDDLLKFMLFSVGESAFHSAVHFSCRVLRAPVHQSVQGHSSLPSHQAGQTHRSVCICLRRQR